VTGTRGKTTTAYLIYEILKSAFGQKVHLSGNVKGSSTLALLGKIKVGDIVVLELDSWCLHGFGDIKKSPQISVFTNLLPDHLNFYLKGSRDEAGAMQKYFMDKAQIFAHQTKNDYLILDEEIRKIIIERYKGKIQSRIIMIPSTNEIKNWKLKIKGEHNLKHILQARVVAKILGVADKIIKKAVENFGGVAGRQEYIREYQGIKIYNDTTATTPDATVVALKSLGDIKKKNIVLIMGGADKNLDMSGLVSEIPKYCKSVILLFGSGSEKLQTCPVVRNSDLFTTGVKSLEEAVMVAISKCKKEDTLLFSPAFASFGMFKNEFDRGEKFVKIIKSLK
jgi:UDP-N-acetylmuramoylalanine--D-glutamate ligase